MKKRSLVNTGDITTEVALKVNQTEEEGNSERDRFSTFEEKERLKDKRV